MSSILSSSFRDPSGFIYKKGGVIYRQINTVYKDDYDFLKSSGLCEKLQKELLLIGHKEVDLKFAYDKRAYKVIKPVFVPFISYPYGWCFSMLKDAALLTLLIQRIALDHGMSLKDASAFNIQFLDGKPIFIDTLSFEKYNEGEPWVAYKQLCQHFFAPLSLMALTDLRLNQLLKVYLDGIPLDLTSKLLPKRSYLNFSIFSHIHLHAISQAKYADKQINVKKQSIGFTKIQMLALVDNLYSTIDKLQSKKTRTEWGKYYSFTNYEKKSFLAKGEIVREMVKKSKPRIVWDLGANDGYFSRIAASCGAVTVASDIDPIAVENNYLKVKKNKEKNIIPIIVDLTNPTADYGWINKERDSLVNRGPADTVMALALIHHLAIGNNLPFDKIANFLLEICNFLIIEFVPKTDSKVKILLASREDIFFDYNQKNFEVIFSNYFRLVYKKKVKNSLRTVYLYKKK